MSLRARYDEWRSRPLPERWMISLPIAALVAAALYIGVWEPLVVSIGRLRAALPELVAQKDAIRAQADELRSASAPSVAPSLRTTMISASLERRELAGAGTIEPVGENRARLAFAHVPFHSLWPLLQDLQNEQGLRIVSLRMDRLDAGNVRVEAVLAAGEH